MNKRKLEINDVKKALVRGKKHRTVTTKYEIALSYFKQKDVRKLKIFSITSQNLILDFIEQLSNAELIYKLEHELQEDLQQFEITGNVLKLGSPFLKMISKEYPIQEIVECLSVKKEIKTRRVTLEICKNKLMTFFKHLRVIYPEFCFCVGEKIIIDDSNLSAFYDLVKIEWAKLYERGRMSATEKNVMMICRSLFFIGTLVENNIFKEEADKIQNAKKEQTAADETKSEKKKNVKGITYPVSSTYSFGSNDMVSSFSYKLYSQKSNEETISKNGGFSEKSQKVLPKHRTQMWDKVEIGNLKVSMQSESTMAANPEQRVEVDLLSNDVENILIQHAFKIQKLKDACEKNNKYGIMNPYEAYQDYYHPYYQNYQMGYPQYYTGGGNQGDLAPYQSRRNFNFQNYVEVRKTQSRMGGNKYS